MGMSRSESGKLGARKSRVTCAIAKQKRMDGYNKNPEVCRNCNVNLSYEENQRGKVFCTQTCAALFNNKQRVSKQKLCSQCGVNRVKGSRLKFCSTSCAAKNRHMLAIETWKSGRTNITHRTIKEYLFIRDGKKCSSCEISEWQGKPIVFDLEHKDGHSENNSEENLCLLCPNCHSQTDTYKAKNKGNGRHSRRIRYAEGKSY
jgi:hypothetical protein